MGALEAVGTLDRQKYIGGSDAAAILGLSKWATPLDVFLKKTGQVVEENSAEKELFFKRRKRQEPVVAEILTEEYGIDIVRLSTDGEPNRYLDGEYSFIAAEIDFEFRMNDAAREWFPAFQHIADGTVCNGEIKTVHSFAANEWGEQGSEEIPIYYAAQVMHGLGVTRERPGTLVAALFGVDELVGFPILRDDETIAGMRAKEAAFWTEHVLKSIPPEPSNMDDIKYLFAKAMGRPVELDDATAEKVLHIANLRKSIKADELALECLQFEVALAVCKAWGLDDPKNATDNASILHRGVEIATWKGQRGAWLDQKRLAVDHPEIIRKYTNEGRIRGLRTKFK